MPLRAAAGRADSVRRWKRRVAPPKLIERAGWPPAGAMSGQQPEADVTLEGLTTRARAGVRRFPWRSVASGAAGASAIGLLGAAGLAPLLLAVAGRQLAEGTLAAWLGEVGGNALAGRASVSAPYCSDTGVSPVVPGQSPAP